MRFRILREGISGWAPHFFAKTAAALTGFVAGTRRGTNESRPIDGANISSSLTL